MLQLRKFCLDAVIARIYILQQEEELSSRFVTQSEPIVPVAASPAEEGAEITCQNHPVQYTNARIAIIFFRYA